MTGLITAPDKMAVAGATVTVSGEDGHSHVSVSGADGTFLLTGLSSGSYAVHVVAGGFSPLDQAAVPVAVGRTTELRLRLSVAGAAQTVEVVAAQAAFDSSQTSSVVNIDRDRVEELPIPNRNYLSFVALSPQASPANPAIAAQTGIQTEIAFGFGGLRPSSNAIHIDGVGDDDEYLGSSRTQLSPEAINDFQIVNHGFAAESGGAAGGVIDVQTRSGVYQRHGDVFVFAQNGALNGTPPLEATPYKPDESRLRAGVALGGTARPDRIFYYMAAEQELAYGEDANDLSPATLARIDGGLRQTGLLEGLNLQPGFFSTTGQETEISGRLDGKLTTHESAMLRYAFTNTRHVNDSLNTDTLSDRTARGSSFIADNSVNGTLSSSFGASGLNALSFELAQRRAVERTGDTETPGVLIPGVALFGTPYFGNSRRFETHVEIEDGLLRQVKHHLLQAGGGMDRVGERAQVEDGGRGLFVFPGLDAFTSGSPDFFTRSFFSNPDTNFAEYRVHAFAQDHWTPSRRIAVDLGLRYEDNHLPTPLPQHPVNFSPRAGVAWSLTPSLVLRSGFGIFYDRFLLSTVNRLFEQDGIHGFSQTLEGSAAAAVYRGGQAVSQPLASVAPSIWRAQPGLRNPYAEVASFSVEQAVPLQTTLKAEYQYAHGVRLGRTTNINLAPPTVLSVENAPSLGVASPTAQQIGRPVFSPLRANPAFDAVDEFATTAGSTYNGVTLTVNRQFTDDLQILAGYTFSKTTDDASYDTEQPQNPFATAEERALSLQDQRHRVTLSGLWLIGPDLNDPQDAVQNANQGELMRLLTGFEFAPILSVGSGFRANPLTGLDSNREHIAPFAARPLGLGRNSMAASTTVDFDLRVLKILPLGPGHLDVVAESFNLLNHRNVTLLDTAYGSGGSPQAGFGNPIAASTARRVQFSLDFEF